MAHLGFCRLLVQTKVHQEAMREYVSNHLLLWALAPKLLWNLHAVGIWLLLLVKLKFSLTESKWKSNVVTF
jgi:hypothetical protein